MTQEEIADMARQAGAEIYGHPDYATICVNGKDARDFVKAFAKLVAEAEREACAKVCDLFQERDVGMQPAECAGAIRARGEA